jgi:hypothetical protein
MDSLFQLNFMFLMERVFSVFVSETNTFYTEENSILKEEKMQCTV